MKCAICGQGYEEVLGKQTFIRENGVYVHPACTEGFNTAMVALDPINGKLGTIETKPCGDCHELPIMWGTAEGRCRRCLDTAYATAMTETRW